MHRTSTALAMLFGVVTSAHAQSIDVTGPLSDDRPSYEPTFIDRVRLDGGAVLPFVAIGPNAAGPVLGGGGVRLAASFRIVRPFWIEGDFFGLGLHDGVDSAIMTGGTAVARYHTSNTFGLGLGVSAGYLSTGDDEYLTPSLFVGPVVVPMSVWFGGGHLELRIPLWFADTLLDDSTALQPALVAPQATLTFGGRLAPPMFPYDGGRNSI